MKNEKIEIELQTTRTEKPGKDQDARIEFYTQQRRIEFGKYLFQIAEKIRAERAAQK